MAKEYVFNWRTSVAEALREGAYFDRWEEEFTAIDVNNYLSVDDHGFFLQTLVEGREAAVLDLTQVSEVRRGMAPKDGKLLYDLEFRGDRNTLDERTLTVVSGLDLVNLSLTHFVAQTADCARVWLAALAAVIHNPRINHVCPMTCLIKHWKMLVLSVNERRKIPVKSITRTFASGKTERMVLQCLAELKLCAGNKTDEIEPEEFTFDKFNELYNKICPRSEIQDLFQTLTNSSPLLTDQQLISFLNVKQRDPRLNEILFPFFDTKRVYQLLQKYEPDKDAIEKRCMTVEGFLRYLMSDDNCPVHLDRIELYQDMEQPLAHYYVNSSHNTYLKGRQFGGQSSVEMYRQVLLTGCRCIELDCWDGTGVGKDEPIITHGKAMCTDVLFKDVIDAIKQTAFVVSDYPVILSFENHCSKANQLKMARYCIDIFGDLLLQKPLDNYPLEPGAPLPPPCVLLRKILIKNKRLKNDVEAEQLQRFQLLGKLDEQDEDVGETAEFVVGEDGPLEAELPPSREMADNEAHPELKSLPSIGGATSDSFNLKSKIKLLTNKTAKEPVTLSKEEEESLMQKYQYTSATTNIHPLLSSLVNYTHPIKFQGFDISEQQNCHFHMSSFSESTGLGYLKQSVIEFVNYNKRQVSRIYPKGGRVDSSNYLPQIFWNAGCQMVSLNFQTPDLAMQINQGRFEYNGNCGYLLKPDFMRRPDRQFDPFSECPVDGVIAATCSVQVISGQFLSDRKIGTYVEVESYGLPADTIRKEFRTRTVPANGLNPVYNEEPFVFRKVVLPDLAVLRFAVYEENGKMIAQRILPLDGLQAGYRHISLRTETNLPMTLPTLFCHIQLKTYVPEGFGNMIDGLADPRSYIANVLEKRENMLREGYGINSEDIGDVPQKRPGVVPPSATAPQPTTPRTVTPTSTQPVSARDPDEIKIEPENLDGLKQEKEFVRLKKKQEKEMSELKKKHAKARDGLVQSQTKQFEKVRADSVRQGSFRAPGKPSSSSLSNGGEGDGERSNGGGLVRQYYGEASEKVKGVVSDQTKEWSDLIRQQKNDEYMLNKQHTREQCDLHRRLAQARHKVQMEQLRTKLTEASKQLRSRQTKTSIQSSKDIQLDKNIKTKGEKERRIKELQETQMKNFIEEYKRQEVKNARMVERLEKLQNEQLDQLDRDARKALELQDQMHQEAILAAKPETIV